MVSNDTSMEECNLTNEENSQIESELEVKTYIQNLKFALNSGAKIDFQAKRLVDEKRNEKYTNQYTVNKLFPDENPVDALKRELLVIYGNTTTFVMSFHFAEKAFTPEMFPYKKKIGGMCS